MDEPGPGIWYIVQTWERVQPLEFNYINISSDSIANIFFAKRPIHNILVQMRVLEIYVLNCNDAQNNNPIIAY